MGAGASVITVPSTAVGKDIEVLKGICPSRFRVEEVKDAFPGSKSSGSHNELQQTTILCDSKSSLTLILIPFPTTAVNRIGASCTTFVLADAELRTVVNRCQQSRPHLVTWRSTKNPKTNNELVKPHEEGVMAELKLPGGAGVALVSASSIGTTRDRRDLALSLAKSMTQSLPKSTVKRTMSWRGRSTPVNTSSFKQRSHSTSRVGTPLSERRQSVGAVGRTDTPTSYARDSPPVIDTTNSDMNEPAIEVMGLPRSSDKRGRVTRHHSFGSTGLTSLSDSSSGNRSVCTTPIMGNKKRMPSPVERGKMKLFPSSPGGSRSSSLNRRLPLTPKRSKRQQRQEEQIQQQPQIPSFPTLKCNVLYLNGKFQPDVVLNSQHTIKIETELFIGHMVMIVRPENPKEADPFWNERIFAQKQRRLVVQIQGKFKYEPKGTIFAGLEASNNHLQMGRLAKGIAGVALKWAEAGSKDLSYSFGGPDGLEKPHLVVPAHTFFDRVVVTPPGQSPPSLLEPITEEAESIQHRMAQPQTFGDPYDPKAKSPGWMWNTTDIYSFSFYTSNVDLPTWTLLNMPELQDVYLNTLIGSSKLRFVMYEKAANPDSDKRHLLQSNRYLFVVQMKHASTQEVEQTQSNGTQASLRVGENILDWANAMPVEEVQGEDKRALLTRSDSDKFPRDGDTEPGYGATNFIDDDGSDGKSPQSAKPQPQPQNVFISPLWCDKLSHIDRLCPAWIDMCAARGNYTRAYAFNVNKRTVFRTAQSFRDMLGIDERCVDNICSPRLSKSERSRRQFGQMLEHALNGRNGEALKTMMTSYGSHFLRRRDSAFLEKNTSKTAPSKAGVFLARALSDRHWIEEFAKVNENNISFYHPETKKAHFRVQMQSVLRVRRLDSDEAPLFHNHYFMAVETLGRTVYMMFSSYEEQRDWFSTISSLVKQIKSQPSTAGSALELSDPRGEFLQESSMWDMQNRRLLNSRRYSFRSPTSEKHQEALHLVEDALRKALAPDIGSDDAKLQIFFDASAKLKNANAHSLKDSQRLTFFLNLYHIMTIHASLVLGLPDSKSTWVKHQQTLAYQCSDDIFSLMELEHCIIRAKMTPLALPALTDNPTPPKPVNKRLVPRASPLAKPLPPPTQPLPPPELKFDMPLSQYSFAIKRSDFRVNFALNCGSISNPKSIHIYNEHMLDEQLDDACKQYLDTTVSIKLREGSFMCVLPRLCQWYSGDFGTTNYSLLKSLEPFLNDGLQQLLDSAEFCDSPCTVKYLPFSFECQRLTIVTIDSPQQYESTEKELVPFTSSIVSKVTGNNTSPTKRSHHGFFRPTSLRHVSLFKPYAVRRSSLGQKSGDDVRALKTSSSAPTPEMRDDVDQEFEEDEYIAAGQRMDEDDRYNEDEYDEYDSWSGLFNQAVTPEPSFSLQEEDADSLLNHLMDDSLNVEMEMKSIKDTVDLARRYLSR